MENQLKSSKQKKFFQKINETTNNSDGKRKHKLLSSYSLQDCSVTVSSGRLMGGLMSKILSKHTSRKRLGLSHWRSGTVASQQPERFSLWNYDFPTVFLHRKPIAAEMFFIL